MSIDDTKQLCCGEDIALRVVQYFQSLPHTNDRVEQWIEQLVEKVLSNKEKKNKSGLKSLFTIFWKLKRDEFADAYVIHRHRRQVAGLFGNG